MSAGGAGIWSIPEGGVGIDNLGKANKRTVAISMGCPSVLESIVPDTVFCAIIAEIFSNNSKNMHIFFIFFKKLLHNTSSKTMPSHGFS
jgi:hypothetical protein